MDTEGFGPSEVSGKLRSLIAGFSGGWESNLCPRGAHKPASCPWDLGALDG